MNSTFTMDDLSKFVEHLIKRLGKRQVILLYGEVGAGKTTLVAHLAGKLGASGVQSPTFAIHNSYAIAGLVIDHIDLYRTEDYELEPTGFYDLFDRENGLICIEWADKLPGNAIPKNWDVLKVTIDFGDTDHNRTYRID